jgi:hypothetical protein
MPPKWMTSCRHLLLGVYTDKLPLHGVPAEKVNILLKAMSETYQNGGKN